MSAAPDVSLRPVDFGRLGPPPGRRLLVVGGCGGIGRALVRAAVDTGLQVAVFDLPPVIEAHRPPSGVAAISVDATDEAKVADAFAALDRSWSGLDGLVNLTGFTNARVSLDRIEPAEFDSIVAGSLRSTYLVARQALPRLKEKGGAIVHTASGLATRLLSGFAPYGAAKAGVIALTKAIAVENAPAVRANTIAPSATDTEFLRGGTGRAPTHGGRRHTDAGGGPPPPPMGRIGQPEDVVGPILFLLGDASRFMTGQVLYVNGGGITP